MTREQILKSLSSNHCEGCGKDKDHGKSHCRTCYYKLPVPLRWKLYNAFGRGYEEAFEESLQVLATLAKNKESLT